MSTQNTFKTLGISAKILPILAELGYETPTPIQDQSIPIFLNGQDLLAQAQTGTGKTAAFALPILSTLALDAKKPQALILAPTRELAIQVAESFQTYAKHIPHFHVLPIYGGQEYRTQLKALKRGVHVVVGTPGRVMDHMRRGSLDISEVKTFVLDEADEMLNMGFIEDIEWILEHMPEQRQTALFSATIPHTIRKVADKYLKNAAKIAIKSKARTVSAIKQYYMHVTKHHKLDALTRYLEVEETAGVIIFARTKISTSELADKLSARGYNASALNGDMNQTHRENVIERIKRGSIDIVVATDVAARGLDVERISHVINYDIPYDTESYIHRIGRTGRAGRTGTALLFVSPREQHMLRDIERAISSPIEAMMPPSIKQINNKRVENFTTQIMNTLTRSDLDYYRELVEGIVHDTETSELDIAAALAFLAQKDKPITAAKEDKLLKSIQEEQKNARQPKQKSKGRNDRRNRNERGGERSNRFERSGERGGKGKPRVKELEADMTRCRIQVGRDDGVRPGDIVGAIANRSNINSKHIGPIHIYDNYTDVDLSNSVLDNVVDKMFNHKLQGRMTRIEPVKKDKNRPDRKRSSDKHRKTKA